MESIPKKVPMMRTLIYFPIVHTSSDMGELGNAVKNLYLTRVGRIGWKRKQDMVNRFWDLIEHTISGLKIDPSRIKIYQDALPAELEGKELEILEQLADSGSRNHIIVRELVRKGATLVGTESINLLMSEYDLSKKIINTASPRKKSQKKEILERQDETLKKRDRFIASRINDTLHDGETGILFLGMLHNIKPWLAEDIEVIFPIKADTIVSSHK